MSKKAFSFFIDGKGAIAKKFNPKDNLNLVRKTMKDKLNSSIVFYFKEAPIDINEEEDYTLEEIAKEEKVFLKHDISNLQNFQIHLNGKLLTNYSGANDEKLNTLRKNLGNKINDNSQFLDKNNSKIDKEDEEGENGYI